MSLDLSDFKPLSFFYKNTPELPKGIGSTQEPNRDLGRLCCIASSVYHKCPWFDGLLIELEGKHFIYEELKGLSQKGFYCLQGGDFGEQEINVIVSFLAYVFDTPYFVLSGNEDGDGGVEGTGDGFISIFPGEPNNYGEKILHCIIPKNEQYKSFLIAYNNAIKAIEPLQSFPFYYKCIECLGLKDKRDVLNKIYSRLLDDCSFQKINCTKGFTNGEEVDKIEHYKQDEVVRHVHTILSPKSLVDLRNNLVHPNQSPVAINENHFKSAKIIYKLFVRAAFENVLRGAVE